jgi:HD-like signal output (HDOD) protein
MASSTSFMAVLTALFHAIGVLFSFLLAKHNTKNDKKLQKQNDLNAAKDNIANACDNGSISDLIDSTLTVKEINTR